MKSAYSVHWKSSTNPRKQRKYQYNAPLHTRGSFLHAPLSKELRKKHNTRSARVRKGDKVAIMRGQFKGRTGTVDRVDLSRNKIYVAGMELSKKDGSKVPYPLNASNVMITTIASDDKRRFKSASNKSTSEE
ncbi:MAG: 50S ribosomal protein L24 [Candidatus Woesearchaeota archaeon]